MSPNYAREHFEEPEVPMIPVGGELRAVEMPYIDPLRVQFRPTPKKCPAARERALSRALRACLPGARRADAERRP